MSRRYRLSLLMGYPAGGVSCTGTCSPCRCGALWGACLLCRPPALPPRCLVGWRGCFGRLPTPPLVYFPAPSPLPPFPSGEGGDFLFSYARGFAPCIPGAEPGRHRSRGAYHALAGDLPGWSSADLAVPESAGVACLACRLPPLPLALILPPSPCPPSRREGGDFLFSYARGFAPCIPGIRPPAALTEPAMQVTGGGAFPRRCRLGGRWRYPAGACPLCRLPPPPLAFFPAPYPPDPLPRWGRGGI